MLVSEGHFSDLGVSKIDPVDRRLEQIIVSTEMPVAKSPRGLRHAGAPEDGAPLARARLHRGVHGHRRGYLFRNYTGVLAYEGILCIQ